MCCPHHQSLNCTPPSQTPAVPFSLRTQVVAKIISGLPSLNLFAPDGPLGMGAVAELEACTGADGERKVICGYPCSWVASLHVHHCIAGLQSAAQLRQSTASGPAAGMMGLELLCTRTN